MPKEGGKAKAGGQNERMELIGRVRESCTGGRRRVSLGERAKGGQVVWCEREGGHAGRRKGRHGNKRANREKQKRKRGMRRDRDISNVLHLLTDTHKKHLHTLTHTREREVVLPSALLLAL